MAETQKKDREKEVGREGETARYIEIPQTILKTGWEGGRADIWERAV